MLNLLKKLKAKKGLLSTKLKAKKGLLNLSQQKHKSILNMSIMLLQPLNLLWLMSHF